MKEEGFNYSFDPNACSECGGHCCTGESGNIFLSELEQRRLARHFTMDIESFRARWCVKVGARFSLKEVKIDQSYDCILFDKEIGGCSVYELRPKQCRTFPFWDYYMKYPDVLQDECPGVSFEH